MHIGNESFLNILAYHILWYCLDASKIAIPDLAAGLFAQGLDVVDFGSRIITVARKAAETGPAETALAETATINIVLLRTS